MVDHDYGIVEIRVRFSAGPFWFWADSIVVIRDIRNVETRVQFSISPLHLILTNKQKYQLYCNNIYKSFSPLYNMNNEKRAKFLRIYANIPEELRRDIIVIVEDKTYTWNTSYLEIRDNTLLGQKILKALEDTKII